MEEGHCSFFLSKKNRFCANTALKGSQFCGNHNPKAEDRKVPCPIDPSHSILVENLEAHRRKCPLYKQVEALKSQSFYMKGINAGVEDEDREASHFYPVLCHSEAIKNIISSEYSNALENSESNKLSSNSSSGASLITSDMKRNAIYKMPLPEFFALLSKIKSVHQAIFSNMESSYVVPEACGRWLKKELNQELPFQEKHVLQQASILGNMENFGLLQRPLESVLIDLSNEDSSENNAATPAVVEFGAGRGYLTHMLTSCYNIKKVFLVERRSYKLKADRSLRQEQDVILERLRIDIEDLNLDAVESLSHVPYLAVGKHLCGPATDLTLRCCLHEQCHDKKSVQCQANCNLRGLALATCCHHLCQWKSYINKRFLLNMGISKEDFHAITWFSSWAVDTDHGSALTDVDHGLHLQNIHDADLGGTDAESFMKNMKDLDRAVLGLICKEIIDIGRCMWLQENGLDAKLVKYVPSTVSPENHLLMAKHKRSGIPV